MHNKNFLISHRLQTRIDMRHSQTAIHNDSLLYPVKWPLVMIPPISNRIRPKNFCTDIYQYAPNYYPCSGGISLQI